MLTFCPKLFPSLRKKLRQETKTSEHFNLSLIKLSPVLVDVSRWESWTTFSGNILFDSQNLGKQNLIRVCDFLFHGKLKPGLFDMNWKIIKLWAKRLECILKQQINRQIP